MSVETWAAIGIVCGAILAMVTLYQRLVLPMWRAARRTMKRLNEVADDLLGDPANGVPSMKQKVTEQGERLAEQGRQLAALTEQIAEHLEWHAAPGGRPAGPVRPKPNSTPTRGPR